MDLWHYIIDSCSWQRSARTPYNFQSEHLHIGQPYHKSYYKHWYLKSDIPWWWCNHTLPLCLTDIVTPASSFCRLPMMSSTVSLLLRNNIFFDPPGKRKVTEEFSHIIAASNRIRAMSHVSRVCEHNIIMWYHVKLVHSTPIIDA